MGAIAEGLVAYAQPLIDQTDGSHEEMEKAFALGMLCYNLAILPDEASRDKTLSDMRPTLDMDDEEFDEFVHSIVLPMIRRHHEMFPFMHQKVSTGPSQSGPSLFARREKPRRPKRTLQPTDTHRVRVIAGRNTNSVAEQSAADSRPHAQTATSSDTLQSVHGSSTRPQ